MLVEKEVFEVFEIEFLVIEIYEIEVIEKEIFEIFDIDIIGIEDKEVVSEKEVILIEN